MASRRVKLISIAALVAIGTGGWFLHNLMAAQAQGELAQAPLNNQVQVPPAFIMAVDDSGSMTFEGLYPEDEQAYWSNANTCLTGAASCQNGFFSAANVLNTTGRGRYYHIIPNGIRLDQTGNNAPVTNSNTFRLAIPPLDLFGFARSPAYNKQWFDPTVTYSPWLRADGTAWPNASITAARSDPRANGAAGTRGPNPVVTYNFTADDARDGLSFGFRFQPGMRLPAGTQYFVRIDRHPLGCGGLLALPTWQTVGAGGHLITTANNLVFQNNNGGNDRGGGCEINIRHFPAVVFLPLDSAPPPGFITANRTLAVNAGGPGVNLYKYELRASNFSTTAEYNAVIQNFANWYTYYGNRNRAMIAAMTRSLSTVNNMRIGYFSINRRTGNPSGMSGGNVIMRDMAGGGRPALYDSLYTLAADGGTPNRSATVFMGDQFRRTDAGAPIQNACQINAGMLFTDGYTNESVGTTGNAYRNFGDTDSALPRPLGGNPNGNTIADIAYSFYAGNPLRPDLPAGQVPPATRPGCDVANPDPRLNCQKNLHMNFYGITLGTPGEIYEVNAAATADPFTTFPNWTVTGTTNLSPRNVDDMWHASLNTRGGFINAQTPADVTEAMRRILWAVAAGSSPSGTQGLSGSRISARSLAVQPSYEIKNQGTDWSSTLSALRITLDPSTRVVTEVPAWEASNRLAALTPTQRSNRTWFGHSSGASQFNAANITLAMLCNNPRPGMSRCTVPELTALGVTPAIAVDYLMGDVSREVTQSGGILRERSTRLGDIINSPPVVSAPTDDYGYRSLPAPYGGSYNAYMTAKQSRPAMVYVGANDGMLHAFHGGINYLGEPVGTGGTQQFAFIPRSVLGHMGNLLFPYVPGAGIDQKFSHRYYVDGPITVSDAYYDSSWKTVLVGTTGAGARSVFGLDVTNPTGFNASGRLWEIDDQHPTAAVRNSIGHVLGKPVIVPVKNGANVSWKAIFGNGYNSNNGRAVLFVVDIGNGSVQMIEAVEPGAPPTGTNGLGNIIVVDRWGGPDMNLRTRDGYADTVYAADQKGAIWRFDLRSSATSIDTPVFVTQEHIEGGQRYRQPILGGLTATSARGGGVMLLFGTGSFSFVNDTSDASVQALYGVLDLGLSTTLTSASLSTLEIASTVDGVRTIQALSTGVSGWTLALPAGERMVGNPRVASGVVFFPTYAPSVTDGCSTSGFNWLYGLNTRTGGPAMSSVRFGSPTGATQGAGVGALALDTGGTAPVKDIGLTVLSSRDPEVPACDPATDPTCVPTGPTGDEGCFIRITVPGMDDAMFVPYPCGRQSWRQLL